MHETAEVALSIGGSPVTCTGVKAPRPALRFTKVPVAASDAASCNAVAAAYVVVLQRWWRCSTRVVRSHLLESVHYSQHHPPTASLASGLLQQRGVALKMPQCPVQSIQSIQTNSFPSGLDSKQTLFITYSAELRFSYIKLKCVCNCRAPWLVGRTTEPEGRSYCIYASGTSVFRNFCIMAFLHFYSLGFLALLAQCHVSCINIDYIGIVFRNSVCRVFFGHSKLFVTISEIDCCKYWMAWMDILYIVISDM